MAKSVLPRDVKFDFKDLDATSIPDEQTSVETRFSPQEKGEDVKSHCQRYYST